jgi:hypothetical protein
LLPLVEGSLKRIRFGSFREVGFRVIDGLGKQSDYPSIGSPVSTADEAAIRALDRQTDAWNSHDMDAFVAEAMPAAYVSRSQTSPTE